METSKTGRMMNCMYKMWRPVITGDGAQYMMYGVRRTDGGDDVRTRRKDATRRRDAMHRVSTNNNTDTNKPKQIRRTYNLYIIFYGKAKFQFRKCND
jgi:hypothetical protein